MYKLFLCLRYLRRRLLAWSAVAAVALCVALMLIAVSVMNGFLDKVEHAARGLFGDVVIEAPSLSGLARYDEFIEQVRREVPEVEAGSPFILTFGILRVPEHDFRRTIQIAGIRLPERADVTDFEKGLFVQKGLAAPTFDPPVELILRRLDNETQKIRRIIAGEQDSDGEPSAEKLRRIDSLDSALTHHARARRILQNAESTKKRIQALAKQLDRLRREDPAGRRIQALQKQLDELARDRFAPKTNRAILGLGIPGFSFRTPDGETVRVITPGQQITLSLVPLGRGMSRLDITPVTETFSVVDDCSTDVSSIDSEIVYVPFETLQKVNQMDARGPADDPSKIVLPARCSQIQLKVRADCAVGRKLQAVRRDVDEVWSRFRAEHPDAGEDVSVLTWRQRQAKIVAPIQQQRTLVIIMFGIISLVAVVLIFVIFYMIVTQKTRDIGVLKAVGASSTGVAAIFLGYGAAVGVVGSFLGVLAGWQFVARINAVHDWTSEQFGFEVWSKEWFLFEKIPNEVDWTAAVFIVIGAVLAGLAGALIPAIHAARMQPVEALRYE